MRGIYQCPHTCTLGVNKTTTNRTIVCPLISVMLHIPVDCGGHEHKIGSQQVLDEWEWNGCCLVNTYQLGLLQFVTVPRVNILERENLLILKLNAPPSLTHNPPLLPQDTPELSAGGHGICSLAQ